MKTVKNTNKSKQKTVGVIIGRFQLANLHVGHKHLIDTVKSQNDEVCILLGSSGGAPTKRNPLPFLTRKEMIQDLYEDAKVFEIVDSKNKWSENVDKILKKNFKNKNIRLYGSRDSFSKWYFGEFPFVYIKEIHNISGTEIRNRNILPKEKESFRLGMIESHKVRYPISYQTADIVLFDEKNNKIVLGQKEKGNTWFFPGGFVDPTDLSIEDSAKRELSEEVLNIVAENSIKYLGSIRVDDHRYRNEEDKIMTSLFLVKYKSGKIKAGDDLKRVKWFSLKEAKEVISETHAPLLNMFLEKHNTVL